MGFHKYCFDFKGISFPLGFTGGILITHGLSRTRKKYVFKHVTNMFVKVTIHFWSK